ncbi:MAG TPA: hypothetical protein VK084_02775 [Chitinophagaceae bacterium]|nr:hypothetical protein [Chitinophagaceae bacterium]
MFVKSEWNGIGAVLLVLGVIVLAAGVDMKAIGVVVWGRCV